MRRISKPVGKNNPPQLDLIGWIRILVGHIVEPLSTCPSARRHSTRAWLPPLLATLLQSLLRALRIDEKGRGGRRRDRCEGARRAGATKRVLTGNERHKRNTSWLWQSGAFVPHRLTASARGNTNPTNGRQNGQNHRIRRDFPARRLILSR